MTTSVSWPKTGRWLGGITPTGFASEAVQAVTVDGRTKRACRLRLLPEEAETVKAMYSLFARLGSLTAVVKGLQERGLTTKNGNTFTRHAVRDILHNPVYARADADMLAWLGRQARSSPLRRRSLTGGTASLAYHRTDQSRGRTAVALPPDWIVAVGQHLAHPGSQWAAVQGRLRRTDCRTPRTEHETPALLAGLLQCRCGRPMYAKYRRAADGERFFLCLPCEIDRRTGNNAAARTFLALQQTPPCAPCSAPCRRTMPRWRPHSGGCGAACLNPPLRRRTGSPSCSAIAWTPFAGRSASPEALTEQLRWDGETLRVTLRRVDCK